MVEGQGFSFKVHSFLRSGSSERLRLHVGGFKAVQVVGDGDRET